MAAGIAEAETAGTGTAHRAGPGLSVIMAVHRENPWLAQAIDSVLAQDDGDFEFLIAANACTDALWATLQEFAARDARIRLFRTAIGQLAFNLNLLADRAQGDYLVRMDADDLCEPHRIRVLRQALRQERVDVLGSAVTLIDADGRPAGRMDLPHSQRGIRRALRSRTALCHPAVAVRRRFLLEMRGYLGGFSSEDTDLWLRAVRAGATMKNLPDALLRYRVHEKQSIAGRAWYAEVAGQWLRELLTAPDGYTLLGFGTALAKSLFAPMLPGIRRYRRTRAEKHE